jgi:hypothetical protein
MSMASFSPCSVADDLDALPAVDRARIALHALGWSLGNEAFGGTCIVSGTGRGGEWLEAAGRTQGEAWVRALVTVDGNGRCCRLTLMRRIEECG